jgi:integrase
MAREPDREDRSTHNRRLCAAARNVTQGTATSQITKWPEGDVARHAGASYPSLRGEGRFSREILKELQKRGKLVFANSEGNMCTHSWDDCKKVGERAKVTDRHPHRFRATFATTLLQNGVGLKTVQKLLGHKNLESTMRYLAKAESPKVRAKVNAVRA